MDPLDLYEPLHNEVVDRQEGVYVNTSQPVSTRWNEFSITEQKVVKADAPHIAAAVAEYADLIDSYNDTCSPLLAKTYPDSDSRAAEILPEEMFQHRTLQEGTNEVTRCYENRLEHPGTSGFGHRSPRIHNWMRDHAREIIESETVDQFSTALQEREYCDPDQRYDQIVAGWEDHKIDWDEALWALVTDEELGIKDTLEARLEYAEDIEAQAAALTEQLDQRIEELVRQRVAPPSLTQRVTQRLTR